MKRLVQFVALFLGGLIPGVCSADESTLATVDHRSSVSRSDLGSQSWVWTTEMLYFPLLAADAIDLTEPFFNMYVKQLPNCEKAAKQWWSMGRASIRGCPRCGCGPRPRRAEWIEGKFETDRQRSCLASALPTPFRSLPM